MTVSSLVCGLTAVIDVTFGLYINFHTTLGYPRNQVSQSRPNLTSHAPSVRHLRPALLDWSLACI